MRARPAKLSPAWDMRHERRRAALADREAMALAAVDPLGERGVFGMPVWAYPAVGVAAFVAMALVGAALLAAVVWSLV